MFERRGDGRSRPGWRTWSDARATAVALIVVGVILPLVAWRVRSVPQPVFEAAAMAVVAAGLVLLGAQARRGMSRRLDALSADVQSLADRGERLGSHTGSVKGDVAAVAKRLDAEQRNLGMVAGGLGDLRQIVRLERQNLGLVANGVEEIRDVLRTFHDVSQVARDEAQATLSRLDDAATRMDAILARQDDLQGELQVERRNLGMVAGALDDVRRLAAGVHLFDARQAALEDALIEIADRVDRIDADDPPPVEGDGTAVADEQRVDPQERNA